MPRSSQWSLAFGPPNQNPENTSPLPNACHMSRPPHTPWSNDLWSSPLYNFSHYPSSSLLGPNILLNTLFSENLSLCSSLKVRDQVSHPNSTTGKITVLYILVFSFFFYMRLEDKRFWTEWEQSSPNLIYSWFHHETFEPLENTSCTSFHISSVILLLGSWSTIRCMTRDLSLSRSENLTHIYLDIILSTCVNPYIHVKLGHSWETECASCGTSPPVTFCSMSVETGRPSNLIINYI
jgi:hypothetical protein